MKQALLLSFLVLSAALAQPLKVAILWHQHQPPYENPLTGQYEGPWVRAHGVNDYPWMAEVLKEFPEIKVTFDYTSTLLKQIADYLSGKAKDAYWRLSVKPLGELTPEERAFIVDRFFDINPRFVEKSPRYKELQAKKIRGEAFSDQDLLDLRVLWNLYWINVDYIERDPGLRALYQKDRGFTQKDVDYVLGKHLELMATILPLHQELWERGQIDLITTPYYHPILPILLDKEAIRESNPALALPKEPIAWPEDAAWQVRAGKAYFKGLFGREPKGMWPPEGAVSQKAAELYAEEGIGFLVTDEAILGKSGFPVTPATLTRIYHVEKGGKRVVLFFRHRDLSDRIGFSYSGMPAERAVEDFIGTLLEIRRQVIAQNPEAVLTIALDGENAWENYPNNGNDFRRLLYKRLTEEQRKGTLKTVLFSELLEKPSLPIARLGTGGWAGDFAMWAGEPEENEAWDRLARARQAVLAYKEAGGDPQVVEKAMGLIYAAQASDWFWWYGQDTGFPNNPPFDEAFRALLQSVYRTLGQKPPEALFIAVRPPVAPQGAPGRVKPNLDGRGEAEEWKGAAYLADADGTTMQTPDDLLKGVYLGFDEQSVYLRVDLRDGVQAQDLLGQGYRLHVYATTPREEGGAAFPEGAGVSLGFPLQQRITLDLDQVREGQGVLVRYAYREGAWVLASSPADLAGRRAWVGEEVEMRIPYTTLKAEAGDTLRLAVVLERGGRVLDTAPNGNPLALSLPQRLAGKEVFRLQDPEGDEHGPGTYTYPKENAFAPFKGLFDLLEVRLLDSGATWTFVFTFGEMTNPWGAPAGFSHQLVNVYLDFKEGGRTDTFAKGAKVAFDPEHPWDLFLKAAGWPQYGQRVGFPDGTDTADGVVVASNPADKQVILQLDKKHFNPAPGQRVCLYVLVGSQDGYGPDHFRPVGREAGPWNLGGAANEDAPLVVDYLWPERGVQEAMLSQYGGGRYAVLKPYCLSWPAP
ncbi:glucodextranase DOMON-like domain-containing protein [Thermus amyloliquefaciens]|uniref:glucodextranase DOMON-like domain-containing protein n=1 Tax=Thermus amyloliquefaciens TaxID=1449080 RepID=UPI00056ED565|nr:glucodextranase DOMON-like domain-containing protein [Thermus amyloliquefaciens]